METHPVSEGFFNKYENSIEKISQFSIQVQNAQSYANKKQNEFTITKTIVKNNMKFLF